MGTGTFFVVKMTGVPTGIWWRRAQDARWAAVHAQQSMVVPEMPGGPPSGLVVGNPDTGCKQSPHVEAGLRAQGSRWKKF